MLKNLKIFFKCVQCLVLASFGNMAGAFILLIGISILFSPNSYSFECKRLKLFTNQGQCQLKSQGILGLESLLIPIKSLQNAKVIESFNNNDEDDPIIIYRVQIVTTEKNISLLQPYTTGLNQKNKKEQIAEEIRVFINNQNKESLYIEDDRNTDFFLMPIIICTVGIIIIIISSYSVVSFYSLIKYQLKQK